MVKGKRGKAPQSADDINHEALQPATPIEQAEADLGPPPLPPLIPDPVPGLAELRDYYEAVTRAQSVFETKSKAAKSAKADLEAATETLLSVVRRMVNGPELPLFDSEQSEQDLAAMTNPGELAWRDPDATSDPDLTADA